LSAAKTAAPNGRWGWIERSSNALVRAITPPSPSGGVVSVFHFRHGQQTERWFYPDDAVILNRIFGG
jgi:hypothetical protein